jgi:hypothetical protein
MHIRLVATAALLAYSIPDPALAQAAAPPTAEQTFKEIGRSLQSMQRTIAAAQTQPAAAPAVGTELTTAVPVTALAGPSPSAGIGATLEPGTKVRVQGVENGFVQVTPYEGTIAGKPVYVPQGIVKGSFSDLFGSGRQVVDGVMTELLEQAIRLRASVENNPYVRLKGFKVNVGLLPSFDVEFEMKNEPATPPTSAALPSP